MNENYLTFLMSEKEKGTYLSISFKMGDKMNTKEWGSKA